MDKKRKREEVDGISICTVCMNRNHHLLQTIPSWLKTNANEIIIVDWSSIVPVKDSLKDISDNRIKVIRVNGFQKWILTISFNLAIQCAKYNKVLKIDADDQIIPDFFDHHQLIDDIFFCGNWRYARNENERHTNGVVYMFKKHFIEILGYHELITSYGYDDCDLYFRLSKIAKRELIDINKISHIKHDNTERSLERLDVEIEKNRLLVEAHPWKGPFSVFEISNLALDYSEARYCYGCKLDDYFTMKYLDIATKSRNWVKKKKRLYIEVKNGLCNRLRAMASAYNISKNSGRKMVIIWKPDFHCEATFSELFIWSKIFDGSELIESETAHNCVYYQIKEHNQNFVKYDYMNICETNQYIDDQVNQDIYISSACSLNNKFVSWIKDTELLRQLEPQLDIQKIINNCSENFEIHKCIGIHIRMGQNPINHSFEDVSLYSENSKKSIHKWRENSHWSKFLQKIDEILLLNDKQKFFLSCDNNDGYEIIKAKYPDNIHMYTRVEFDRSSGQLKSAVIDLWLLQKCLYILGSNWSSFSEVSHRLNGKKILIAGIDF